MSLSKRIWGIAATSFLLAGRQARGVPASQVERLGQDLTPMGAERAGNADGSIPAWTGGSRLPGGSRPRARGTLCAILSRMTRCFSPSRRRISASTKMLSRPANGRCSRLSELQAERLSISTELCAPRGGLRRDPQECGKRLAWRGRGQPRGRGARRAFSHSLQRL